MSSFFVNNFPNLNCRVQIVWIFEYFHWPAGDAGASCLRRTGNYPDTPFIVPYLDFTTGIFSLNINLNWKLLNYVQEWVYLNQLSRNNKIMECAALCAVRREVARHFSQSLRGFVIKYLCEYTTIFQKFSFRKIHLLK